MRKYIFHATLLTMLGGCSPTTLEDFHYEGEARCKKLVTQLQAIHSREELIDAELALKKQFEALVDLMIEAREFQEKQEEEEPIAQFVAENRFSDVLEEELRRVYGIEG